MADNGAGAGAGAGDGGAGAGGQGAGAGAGAGAAAEVAWHANLPTELATSPSITKFPNTKEGFSQLAKGYTELERVMSNEKIPVPKGPDDKVAIDLFRKAFKIPEKAEGYGLPDVEIPASLKGLAFDKNAFATVVHGQNLTGEQAKGLWQAYTAMNQAAYDKALSDQKAQLTEISNKLRLEWGKDYDGRIQLGQQVINKFTENQEDNDWFTATILKDPRGARILAKIGEQFAENRIGEFKYETGGLSLADAEKELSSMQDPKHPLKDMKAPQADHDRAVARQNELIKIIQRLKQG